MNWTSWTIERCEYDDCWPILCYNCSKRICKSFTYVSNTFYICSLRCMYKQEVIIPLLFDRLPKELNKLIMYNQNNKLCEFSHKNRKWKNFASVYMKTWLIDDLVKIVLEYYNYFLKNKQNDYE